MGTEDGPTPMYSPIKADRWSCECVLLRHIVVGGRALLAGKRLLKFAHQLTANDPQQQLSLRMAQLRLIISRRGQRR